MQRSHRADLIVIGGGGVGLASALAAAESGLTVLLVARHREGEAFPAAAGILGPSIELANHEIAGAEHAFAVAARDRYPTYLAQLEDRSGVTVPLNRLGILQVNEAARVPPGATWLDRPALGALEPALAGAAGAWFYPDDGAVDNVAMLRALEAAVARSSRIRQVGALARAVAFDGDGVVCETTHDSRHEAGQLVLAAGAWSPLIEGLPRALPVEPLRGQMLSLDIGPLTRVVYGPDGYLVPRGGQTLVGATMEQVAFDVSTTESGLANLRRGAVALCPALAQGRVDRAWAGLRPVSPDFLPIIGRDPEFPTLIYACGHSRNGVLMAPLTADCVAAIALGQAPPADLSPFGIGRFSLTGKHGSVS